MRASAQPINQLQAQTDTEPVTIRYSSDPNLAADQRQQDAARLDHILTMTPAEFFAWRDDTDWLED